MRHVLSDSGQFAQIKFTLFCNLNFFAKEHGQHTVTPPPFCMLRRPIHYTIRYNKALIQPRTRPILHSFPTQTRSVRTNFYKNPNPLWFVLTATVSFVSFFYIVKRRRGLGNPPNPTSRELTQMIDPMNQNPT